MSEAGPTQPQQISEAEQRRESAQKVLEFINKVGAYEHMQSLLSSEPNKANMPTFEEFEDFLVRLNGIAREIPIHERKFDGDGVMLAGIEEVTMPRHADKEQLLKEAYEAASHIDRQDVQYLLPAVINAVHLFADGNGRTSRIVHLLLNSVRSKEEFEQELQKGLGINGRFDSFDISPGFISLELNKHIQSKFGWGFEGTRAVSHDVIRGGLATVEFPRRDSTDPQKAAEKEFDQLSRDDMVMGMTAILEVIGRDNLEDLHADYNGNELVSPKKITEKYGENGWRRMIDALYKLKAEKIRALIGVFTKPDEYTITLEDGKTITMREYFIAKVQQRNAEYNKK